MAELASAYDLVVTVEDGVLDGGVGDALARALRKIAAPSQVLSLGLAKDFVPHGRRGDILAAAGLDAAGIAASILRATRTHRLSPDQPNRRASVR